MRILLAGAAGFIGSHLAERFIADGHEVVGVDNFTSGHPRNIAHLLAGANFRLLCHDVIRPLEFDEPLDWVMHFASPASPPKYQSLPVETLRVNAEGTLQLLELAQRHQAGFFLASTSEVYGDPAEHPQSEAYWGRVNPIGPRSVYDEGKRYAEALTTAFHRADGVNIRIIRIFNTYGPNMDPNDGRVISNFIMQALRHEPLTIYGDGAQSRSFQYVDDLVEGVIRLMNVRYHSPVNLGNPEEYTMFQLASLVQEVTGTSVPLLYSPLPEDDPRQRRPDISCAKALLGWEPRVPVREGLSRTVAYFRSHA